MQSYRWTEVQGNPYWANPRKEMIEGEYQQSASRAVKGESKNNVQRLWITYDRQYVIKWLIKKVVKPLGLHTGETKYQEFQKLLSEAIKDAKQGN